MAHRTQRTSDDQASCPKASSKPNQTMRLTSLVRNIENDIRARCSIRREGLITGMAPAAQMITVIKPRDSKLKAPKAWRTMSVAAAARPIAPEVRCAT